MREHSKPEWTDATWNPLRGCIRVSPGCTHCYAETFADRSRGVPGHPYEQGLDPRLVPVRLAEPFEWTGPRTVFVNSMNDLFQTGVPEAYIGDVARVMVEANLHTHQVLTKHADRLQALLSDRLRFAASQPHIWWGVSVEDRRYGLPRIAHLRAAPAAVRFLSIEPLLEDLGDFDLDLAGSGDRDPAGLVAVLGDGGCAMKYVLPDDRYHEIWSQIKATLHPGGRTTTERILDCSSTTTSAPTTACQ